MTSNAQAVSSGGAKPVTLEQFATHYVETLSAQPNAWGQHISRVLGKSSGWIMQEMFTRWGEAASNAAIDQAFRARKGDS